MIRSWDGADGGAVRSNISDTKRTHQSGEATPGKAAAAVEDIAKRVGQSVTFKMERVVADSTSGLKGGITILIQPVDFSNVIARASKTMTDCHNEKIKLKKTGTDG